MRLILSTLFYLILYQLISQETLENNWALNNDKLVWQKVFSDFQLSIKEPSLLALFDEVLVEDYNSITGNLKSTNFRDWIKEDYESLSNMPGFLYTGDFFGTATIEVKDNRYRVTITNIEYDLKSGGYDFGNTIDKSSAFKVNGKIRPSWSKYTSPILDKCFTRLFTFDSTELDDDW